eukprot:2142059-Prymnesium_polylepis.2
MTEAQIAAADERFGEDRKVDKLATRCAARPAREEARRSSRLAARPHEKGLRSSASQRLCTLGPPFCLRLAAHFPSGPP